MGGASPAKQKLAEAASIRVPENDSFRLARQKRNGSPSALLRSLTRIWQASLVDRTTAADSTAARLQVVSKRAFVGSLQREKGHPGQSDAPASAFSCWSVAVFPACAAYRK